MDINKMHSALTVECRCTTRAGTDGEVRWGTCQAWSPTTLRDGCMSYADGLCADESLLELRLISTLERRGYVVQYHGKSAPMLPKADDDERVWVPEEEING